MLTLSPRIIVELVTVTSPTDTLLLSPSIVTEAVPTVKTPTTLASP